MKQIGRMFPRSNFLMIFPGRKRLEKNAAIKVKEESVHRVKREALVNCHKAWYVSSSEPVVKPESVLKILSAPLLTKQGYLQS
jgi:hypothetical protein